MNVDNKFLAVPPHDRDFLVVRSKKDEQGKRFADDQMIPHKTSSTYSLVKQKTKELIQKKNKSIELTEIEKEWLADSPRQHKFFVSEELHTNAHKANGHTVHPRLLVTTNPKPDHARADGRQYTLNFFKRLWPKHAETESVVLETQVLTAYQP